MVEDKALRTLQAEVSRLRQENGDLCEELTLLRSSLRAISLLQNLEEILSPEFDVLTWIDEWLAAALTAVAATDGSLILMDEESGELVFAVVHGEARGRLTGFRMPLSEGIAGWVAENREPAIVRDPRSDSRFNPAIDELLGFKTCSIACVPLIDGDRVLGVIEVINKVSDREFTDQDQDLMMVVANMASTGISRAESTIEKS